MGAAYTKLLNKQSQEGYNVFLSVLLWIPPEALVSGLQRDGGIALISSWMLSPPAPRSNEWRVEESPGIAAKFTGNTNTVISLRTLLLLPIVAHIKREVKFPHSTLWRGVDAIFSLRICFCLYSSRTECTQNSTTFQEVVSWRSSHDAAWSDPGNRLIKNMHLRIIKKKNKNKTWWRVI